MRGKSTVVGKKGSNAGIQRIDPSAITFASEKPGASGQDGNGRRGTNGLTARYHSIDTECEKRHHFWHAGMRRTQVATDKYASSRLCAVPLSLP